MKINDVYSLVILIVAALFLCGNVAAKDEAATPPTFHIEALKASADVATWSIADVEHWLNYTVGYAEYIPVVRKHAIDGPTLLHLTAADIEDHFNLVNSIHLAKLRAHIQLLRGSCVCPARGAARDFWEYFRLHNSRTWIFGTAVLFVPRCALLGAYYLDAELFSELYAESKTSMETMFGEDLMLYDAAAAPGSSGTPYIFMLMAAACPNFLFFVKVAHFFDTNYVLVVAALFHFGLSQYNELSEIFMMIKRRRFFEFGISRREQAKQLFGWGGVFVVIAVVTSRFVPYVVQQLCVALWVGQVVLILVGMVAMFINHYTTKDPADENAKKE